jgi:ribosomal protein S16
MIGEKPSLGFFIDMTMPAVGHTGTYDPIPKPAPLGVGKPFKDIQLDTARAKYWLGVGAQPSDPAWRLLSMVCLSFSWSSYMIGLKYPSTSAAGLTCCCAGLDWVAGAEVSCGEDAGSGEGIRQSG